jgi:chloramphenicol 3-O-phosphotransferase
MAFALTAFALVRMSHGIVRLTLYALISAIESDLRNLITTNLLTDKAGLEIFPNEVLQHARDRMVRDEGVDAVIDDNIIEYLNFSDCIEVLAASRNNLVGPISKAVKRLP